MKIVIQNKKTKQIIAGFSSEHQIVQVTNHKDYYKVFPTKGKATAFINKYSNAGYGMEKGDVEVIEI